MADFPTVDVTINVIDATGAPISGVLCLFRCTRAATYAGIMLPTNISARTDMNGVAVVQLCPSSLFGGSYGVKISSYGYDVRGVAVIPDSDCLLDEVFQLAPYPAESFTQTALAEMVARQAAVDAAASAAQGHAEDAATAAVSADLRASEAETYRNAALVAQESALEAADQAVSSAASIETGIEADQIPHNRDLGPLAWQSAVAGRQVIVQEFADDAAAAAGGVPVGGLYRVGSTLTVRLS